MKQTILNKDELKNFLFFPSMTKKIIEPIFDVFDDTPVFRAEYMRFYKMAGLNQSISIYEKPFTHIRVVLEAALTILLALEVENGERNGSV